MAVCVGVTVGVIVGVPVGVFVGVVVGVTDGVRVGVRVGVLVGVCVGVCVGVAVGVLVGIIEPNEATTSPLVSPPRFHTASTLPRLSAVVLEDIERGSPELLITPLVDQLVYGLSAVVTMTSTPSINQVVNFDVAGSILADRDDIFPDRIILDWSQDWLELE